MEMATSAPVQFKLAIGEGQPPKKRQVGEECAGDTVSSPAETFDLQTVETRHQLKGSLTDCHNPPNLNTQ